MNTYRVISFLPVFKNKFRAKFILTGILILSLSATMESCRSKKKKTLCYYLHVQEIEIIDEKTGL
ncbi:MAG: hypothetical protein A2W91_17705 [Bacteroidetes bacterium GWF2_38_335]|nr:MAG: hypothetical protein A2W91_17705 [Bacteroidetes bacterium GWF2_38_335]OFY78030.1 MAG: hypothetical protein A2281_18755 [Bacteroidetes bacterium RIFOXYA12_FULL_38_20]HBS88302.1 hypothetical protein [Bacteroidales bacterium]